MKEFLRMPSDGSETTPGMVSAASSRPTEAFGPSAGSGQSFREGEARYRIYFQKAPVALWDEDFSAVMQMLKDLRQQGIADLRAYFREQPRLIAKAIDLVRLNDVNEFTLALFEAAHKPSLLRSLADVFLPETETMFVEELVTLWEGGRRFESETSMRTLTGRRINVIFRVAYEGQNCERTLVSIVDVTARKQAEQDARQLAAIVESSDDAIASIDLDGLVTSWNRGAQRLYGYVHAEIIGQPASLLMPPDRDKEERAILERIRGGNRVEHYETIRRHKDGQLIDVSLSVSPVRDAEGRIIGASKIARDITDAKRAQAQQKLLLHEIKHRIKNSLTTVQVIANQTFLDSPAADKEAFAGRLQALAQAHDLLTLESWDRARLADVVERALEPFQQNRLQRLVASGPEATLTASEALLVGLVLHELATNAVKYGALSNEAGQIQIVWDVLMQNNAGLLKLAWHESGGPTVEQPTRKGFGSMLIERAITRELGRAKWEFLPEGVAWSLELPLTAGAGPTK